MSEIALYNTLTKLGVEPDEAERAVADIANTGDLATKAELKAEVAKIETELKYMRWVLGLIFVMNVAILIKLFS